MVEFGSVKDLMESFEGRRIEAQKSSHEILKAIETLEKEAEEKRNEAERLRGALKKIPSVNWKEDVMVPLAEEMAKRTGRTPVVLGPCGIGAKVTIILTDGPGDNWYKQDWLEIVIEPTFEDEHMVFNYETGETCNRYEEGTIGEVNGLNNVTARLPNNIEEIMKLLKHYPAEPRNEGEDE